MEAFDFAVALGVVGRGFDVGHAADADEFLEVFGEELGPLSVMILGVTPG